MKIHQRRITRKVVIGGVHTKVRVGNGGTRHVKRVDDLLKIGGRTIRGDVIGKNNEELDEGKKSKTHWIFN